MRTQSADRANPRLGPFGGGKTTKGSPRAVGHIHGLPRASRIARAAARPECGKRARLIRIGESHCRLDARVRDSVFIRPFSYRRDETIRIDLEASLPRNRRSAERSRTTNRGESAKSRPGACRRASEHRGGPSPRAYFTVKV
ncbi:hypothetical protein [Burkholderia thailandensis]|uniref:hypothetical protein n=1 Tax=Burkholderia thailandensis TaxID=57975 RepID=UPI0012DADB4B|nr:hypothetical protein [Burkholderia thailandensis]MCS6471894.1 hypothetical protein [Burkholderia thailandensis]MCS6517658.1 hypothetical protein [Burkholderia thailandensis]WRS65046.1 hypothetical protein U9S59_13515 [Burkholderia thailandensis]